MGSPLRVSTTGGPEVASGGTGDVVTGLTGAYLGAGMSAADAAAAALFLTGVAAARSEVPAGHLAADVPDRLPEVRKDLSDLGTPSGPLIFASGDRGA
jgi:NAD(P)H-hydrate repair Nnr-like enzyme with NAD(P)H-hydrate dehydratase domain